MSELMQEWDVVIKEYSVALNTFNHSNDINQTDSAIYKMKELESKMELIRQQIRRMKK